MYGSKEEKERLLLLTSRFVIDSVYMKEIVYIIIVVAVVSIGMLYLMHGI